MADANEDKPCCGDESTTTGNESALNIGEGATGEIDWLQCLKFEGPEAEETQLTYLPPTIKPEDLIVPGSIEYAPSGGIIDLQVNNELYDRIIRARGPKAILITSADGERMTREEWYNKKGQTDGLKVALMQHLVRKKMGPGIHIGGV